MLIAVLGRRDPTVVGARSLSRSRGESPVILVEEIEGGLDALVTFTYRIMLNMNRLREVSPKCD